MSDTPEHVKPGFRYHRQCANLSKICCVSGICKPNNESLHFYSFSLTLEVHFEIEVKKSEVVGGLSSTSNFVWTHVMKKINRSE